MMEASEVWHKAQQAWHSVKTPNDGPVQLDHSYPDAAATAIIEQAIRDAITEDRRGRTFTVSELDKARAEGMERAAVIADAAIRAHCDQHGPSGGAWNISMLLERVLTAIRAAKGAGDAK